ncbi:CUB and sushi domain-containing protein 1 [Orchesella cincta]|uniref:CUB and sushi domain-containing protein 1 n=1 Tax=Orchesella cincta TaxID=48709 RepID=A0A1D2N9C8_ORCCI|nr:CUB and sushi domain-containing protein 1 [Orchesella cincta]
MASKSFTLTDPPDNGSGCGKLCICTCTTVFVAIVLGLGFYFYQTTYGGSCASPELDENGLTNWTYVSSSDYVAYACFPGYFLEGDSNLVVSKCENGQWNPPPPACNSLPLRIDCPINNQSLTGNITMWQESSDAPTYIFGNINYTSAVKPQGHLMEHVIISKRTCNVSHIIPKNVTHPYPNKPANLDGNKLLSITFNSTKLKAFRKAELFMNIIFIDKNTTATLVSVHQSNMTLVMAGSHPSLNSTWNWVNETEKATSTTTKKPVQIATNKRFKM